ncbi:56ba3eea-c91d-41ce-9e2b-5e6ba52fc50c [Thermothielavioides terrestris]|uniref:56ba3eea-c91d-41ce-9e2b-5e6ba52fc50c n=1 Tax=Thermothielavioides terrestris TaxID=2587410 RepID=A0A3S4AT67_9PEZI|nr:56ba3eea-c91d-41ce-9e2b-5e6ba52fc50c [Thermothielavioides terrestris]
MLSPSLILPVLALGLLPARAAAQETAGTCVNGPKTRSCWQRGFDIHTDYTALQAPAGKLVEYDLTVSQAIVKPDGYEKLAMVVNGHENAHRCTQGITVHNNFTENLNGTGIHWHGIRQYHSNCQDGVPGVTECPTQPGESRTYEFKVTQYGTSWYHSHFSMQYSNGLYGPLVIHGPSSANWDVDLGPWLIADWYHTDVFGLVHQGEAFNIPAVPDSTLINGKGKFSCDPASDSRCDGTGGEFFEVLLNHGTTYKLAVVSTASLLTYNFWIDGHNFTVISTDFVAVKPYTTNFLTVGIGQRFEIILHANASLANGTNFWIHAQDCRLPKALDWRAGIVRYDANDRSDPYTPPEGPEMDAFRHFEYGCADFDTPAVEPVVPKQVGSTSANELTSADYLRIGQVNATWPGSPAGSPPLFLWVLDKSPLYANWSQPTIKTIALDNGTVSQLPGYAAPIGLEYDTGAWVYVVVTSNYTDADVAAAHGMPRTNVATVHPMHLHGHDFAVLAQGRGPFDPATVTPKLANPPRRDTLNLPPGSFAWIAFQVDNPGAWLLHCHIQWHAADGLALQYIEQPGKLRGLMQQAGALGRVADQCSSFNEWYSSWGIPSEGSGI